MGSCLVAPPCTLVLLTVCKRRSPPWLPPPLRSRSLLLLRGSTLSGSVAPSWPPLHLPTDVDHQARVRRVRSFHCPQEVLLNPIANLEIFVQFSLEKKYMGRFVKKKKKKKKGALLKKKKKKKKKKS